MSLVKRIKILESIENQRGKKLDEAADIPYSTYVNIKNGTSSPNFATMYKLLVHFPMLNGRWLVLGEEPMFLLGEATGETMQVNEDAVSYMKSSSLYNYPLLVDEVQALRKSVAELRKTVEELMEKVDMLENVPGEQ